MKLLRRRVRMSFLLAAVGFLVAGAISATYGSAQSTSAFEHYTDVGLYFAQGTLYLAAFFATRIPSPYRSNVATGASLVTLLDSVCALWQHHAGILDARRGLILFFIAAAGLYVFGQGGSPAKADSPISETA